jgi:surfactin synthase thioesterase subunit
MSGWFRVWRPRPEAPVQLFCLPPAGAAASTYRHWPAEFDTDIEVQAVQLPGRENRLGEPPVIDPAVVAEQLATAVDRPYALFGHSMGGRLAYEIIRCLRQTGATLPVALFVAGTRSPERIGDGPLDGLSRLADRELVTAVARNGMLPPKIAETPDLLELFLPVLRADFEWLDNYQFVPQPPLPMPVIALAGSDDEAVPLEDVVAWQQHAGVGFAYHVIEGGHFFPQEQVPEVAAVIRRTLPPLLAGATAGAPTDLGASATVDSSSSAGAMDTSVRADARAAAADRGRGGNRSYRVELGGWSYWSDALLRTTGFPAAGLDRFVAAEAAEAADAYLAGTGKEELLDEQLDAALAEGSRQVRAIAADPRFREAVTWQNPSALSTLDKFASGGGYRPSVARHRELTVVRYWQRYCAKNETIGFFGPVCWARLDDQQPRAVTAHPGPELLRERRVAFESWALTAYGETLARDPQLRMWLTPVRQPHLHLVDRTVHCPPRPPETLSGPEAAALAACDGSRTAAEVVQGLGLPKEADGVLLLERLVARGLLRWDADLPLSPQAEQILAERIAGIGDPAARGQAAAGFERLRAARDQVASAAGDPAALASALAKLDAEFTAVTGAAPARRAGQTYAGRRLCFEDTARDLSVTIGRPVLQELATPLSLLLRAARWLCAELATAYDTALQELHEELAPDHGEVNLAELWFLAQGMLFGTAQRPVDAVVAEFQRRWDRLLGLSDLPSGTRAHQLRSADLAASIGDVFPDRSTGWSGGRLHSPDLQICAPDLAAIDRGEFTIVLGELHIGWPVFDNALFTGFHPEPARLVTELERDLGPDRVRLLYPPDWPRAGGRLAASLAGPTDVQLGFAPAPGADRDRLLPVAAMQVIADRTTGQLRAHAPDGRSWPLLEVFCHLLAIHTVDSFKLVGAADHTPRVSVDRLVVNRETWRSTVEATGLAEVTGDRDRFLAARRWRAELGLPERVFVRIDTETKPVYVDFRSPHYVRSLCSFLRSAAANGGAGANVVVTEMLPTPEQAWVPDAAGNRYFSELRIQVGERDD